MNEYKGCNEIPSNGNSNILGKRTKPEPVPVYFENPEMTKKVESQARKLRRYKKLVKKCDEEISDLESKVWYL